MQPMGSSRGTLVVGRERERERVREWGWHMQRAVCGPLDPFLRDWSSREYYYKCDLKWTENSSQTGGSLLARIDSFMAHYGYILCLSITSSYTYLYVCAWLSVCLSIYVLMGWAGLHGAPFSTATIADVVLQYAEESSITMDDGKDERLGVCICRRRSGGWLPWRHGIVPLLCLCFRREMCLL